MSDDFCKECGHLKFWHYTSYMLDPEHECHFKWISESSIINAGRKDCPCKAFKV